jgi:hypothetical protein
MSSTISALTRRLLTTSVTCGVLLAVATCAFAADAKPPVTIVHRAIAGSDLPDPGVPMIIKFQLSNTKELERTVRALVVKDGRLIEVPLLKSYLNEKDHPTYEFQLDAPLAELDYQFVAYDGQGGAIQSDRYAIKRDCLPNVTITDLSIDPNTTPDEQLKLLFDRSVKLSDEIEQYEHAVKNLTELQKLLKE